VVFFSYLTKVLEFLPTTKENVLLNGKA